MMKERPRARTSMQTRCANTKREKMYKHEKGYRLNVSACSSPKGDIRRFEGKRLDITVDKVADCETLYCQFAKRLEVEERRTPPLPASVHDQRVHLSSLGRTVR